MNCTRKPATPRGFTLVELLVVIAIITILASIVVPRVATYIGKSQITKAYSEIRSIETSMTGMLSDAGVANFGAFLSPQGRQWLHSLAPMGNPDTFRTAQAIYNGIFYDLLRNGRNASSQTVNFFVNPTIQKKLGTGYMDIAPDPWQNQYFIWIGPHPQNVATQFRSYRGEGYTYTPQERNFANAKTPGAPPADNLPGFPAPKNKEVYIYSMGANLQIDAFAAIGQIYWFHDAAFAGGGDDINNWDPERGWEKAPK